MHALDKIIHDLPFPDLQPDGTPARTVENLESLMREFDVILARPALNAETFTPFFPGRFHAGAPELVRDVHRVKLRDVCLRHRLDFTDDQLARHLQMLGLEQEDRERRKENEKRLARGLA